MSTLRSESLLLLSASLVVSGLFGCMSNNIQPAMVVAAEKCRISYQQYDIPGAMAHCELAAGLGDNYARYLLEVLKGNPGLEFAVLLERARQQEANADIQFALGDAFFKGDGVPRDYQQAAHWYQMAAEKGHVQAMVYLALVYYHGGYGVEESPSQAFVWFQKAAEAGNDAAKYQLGRFYSQGYGVDANVSKALDWLNQAADNGFSPAYVGLATLYMDSFAIEKDITRAIHYYQKAAEYHEGEAQFQLALFFESGLGVDVDQNKAFELMLKAARQVEAGAATKLFHKKLYSYQMQAEFMLGRYYEKGIGTPIDTDKARYWYELAAGRGVDKAQAALQRMGERDTGHGR